MNNPNINFNVYKQFLSQYYGQKIVRMHDTNKHWVLGLEIDIERIMYNYCNYFIVLRDIEKITPEHAYEVSKLENRKETEDHVIRGNVLMRDFEYLNLEPLILIRIVDYLRANGYALEYQGISVEDQIEHKWIKLI